MISLSIRKAAGFSLIMAGILAALCGLLLLAGIPYIVGVVGVIVGREIFQMKREVTNLSKSKKEQI